MCSTGVTSLLSPVRFIRLYDNPANEEKMKKKKKKEEEENKRRRWREAREEEVKDSREKEFIEAYVSSLQDRGETPTLLTVCILRKVTKEKKSRQFQ